MIDQFDEGERVHGWMMDGSGESQGLIDRLFNRDALIKPLDLQGRKGRIRAVATMESHLDPDPSIRVDPFVEGFDFMKSRRAGVPDPISRLDRGGINLLEADREKSLEANLATLGQSLAGAGAGEAGSRSLGRDEGSCSLALGAGGVIEPEADVVDVHDRMDDGWMDEMDQERVTARISTMASPLADFMALIGD